MTKKATASIAVFCGNLPANRAANGAAMEPPTIKPITIYQWLTPKEAKNVMEAASVTKNSARLTVPTT